MRRHLLGLVCALAGADSSWAQHWTATSAPTNSWQAVASSADGSTLVAVAPGSPIYFSTNYGGSWRAANVETPPWTCVACSADGTRMSAGARYSADLSQPGQIYISNDQGQNWVAPGPRNYWQALACSADGINLVAGTTFRNNPMDVSDWLYTSPDQGLTWPIYSDGLQARWCCVASSADASRVFASTSVGFEDPGAWPGRDSVTGSTNCGLTWRDPSWGGIWNMAPSELSTRIACSADGTKVVLATSPGPIFMLTNAFSTGSRWYQTGASTQQWSSVACSADGTRLVATVNPGGIYTSTNSGATWTLNDAPRLHWQAVASSADGSRLVAVVAGGGIFTTRIVSATRLSIALSGGNVVLSWPAAFPYFRVQQNGGLGPGDWADVYATPTITNQQAQVILPLPASNMFYRLIAR